MLRLAPGLLAGDYVEHEKPRRRHMDTDDFTLADTTADLVSAILDEHERVLFDDELEGG